MKLKEFLNITELNFTNISLAEEAFTHPSFSKFNKNSSNYQRLEFLGDKVLSLVISEYLMLEHKDEDEGSLSRRHAALVSGETLSQIALNIGIGKVLRLSSGEENLGGKTNKKNLENALEALIGAIYLDSDYDNVKEFIFKFWHDFLRSDLEAPKDPVSKLQEIIQMNSKQLPQYEITKTGGLEHSPIFTATLTIPFLNLSLKSEGKSKKEAQKKAAIAALEKINSKK